MVLRMLFIESIRFKQILDKVKQVMKWISGEKAHQTEKKLG